jgi:hypothetical protein
MSDVLPSTRGTVSAAEHPLLTSRSDLPSRSSGRYLIGVRSAVENLAKPEALSILQQLLPVEFNFSGQPRTEIAGEIRMDVDAGVVPNGAASVSTLSLPQGERGSAQEEGFQIAVRFSDEPEVPFPFRGRSLRTNVGSKPRPLSLRADERELANDGQGPVWACSERNGAKQYRSAFPIPAIPADGNLRSVLKGERFLEMLPVLHWLREISAASDFEGPPLRACFMFDDPNLHWPRYGHVDFEQMAKQAAKEQYHVSFATIPLDTWFTHRATARLFANHPHQLSLLIHGNNHIDREMGRDYTPSAGAALMRQAMERMKRFEQRTGLPVCRVMVAPGGVCSEAMIAALPGQGFEASCLSHGSLRAHNKQKAWTKKLGLLPSEAIRGCPVLPRWALSSDMTNTILLATYLKQAIILRGHQQDVKAGLEVLDDAARFINSLGPAQWGNMTTLARQNYQWRMDGGTYRLNPLGRKLSLQLPEGAAELAIENPADASWENWQIVLPDGVQLQARAGEKIALPARRSKGPVLAESAVTPVARTESPGTALLAFAVLRRILTEGRDRFLASWQ